MPITRRDLSLLIPALAAAGASAQDKPAKKVLTAASYKYDELPVKQNGLNQSRAVFDGLTHTNFPVELHMTKLAPGQMPHAPHHHVNEEVMMLKNGELEVTQGGVTSRVGPGSIVYVQSNVEHGWKNVGTEPAEYFVIALGPKA
jgi:mannose-6-phosphate isomerase-like protein (cupin superfamily)